MYIANSTDTPCQEWQLVAGLASMWFAKPATLHAQKAKSLCYECPERRECLDAVVQYEQKRGETQHGIYGGLDPKERRVFLELSVAVSA